MERSLLSFIWRYSRREQFGLVVVTSALFPLLYLTLELPKRIINDAIGAQSSTVEFLGLSFSQTTLLILLCFGFLGSVIAHGLLKMRVNTMKGVLAERLLRRFRYMLIGRILRFPRSYQNRVSEGELVSMITAEAEPLGGIMGDAFAHPLLQAGQMTTILLFLFVQNVWFGLAAIALIPVQAWLIPRMQARINVLNRSRIQQVRHLASEIGELSEGAAVLRQHGGWRYRLAAISNRLGGLFETRFEIYRKKFFLKFTNNLLTQITPFFYFLVGGVLVINGQLTIGALVAALSAFKDLSSPWKELLTYYTAIQEVSQRYLLIVERFAPAELLPDFLDPGSEGQAAEPVEAEVSDVAAVEVGRAAQVSLEQVTFEDEDGRQVLNKVDLTLAPGSWTCIIAQEEEDCAALAHLLLREVSPRSGRVRLDDHALSELSQHCIARRIAHVCSTGYVFAGTLDENVMLPLRRTPEGPLPETLQREAERSGNSTDNLEGLWRPDIRPAEMLMRADSDWQRLTELTGAGKTLLPRMLDHHLSQPENAHLCERLVSVRPGVRARLDRAGLSAEVQTFSAQNYVDDLTLPENLFLGIAAQDDWLDATVTRSLDALLTRLDLRAAVLAQSVDLARTLLEVFDTDSTDSASFRRLGLPEGKLKLLREALKRFDAANTRKPRQREADELTLLALVFNLPAAQFDRGFSGAVKAAVIAARDRAETLADAGLKDQFIRFDEARWHPRLSVFENLIFGKIVHTSRPRREEIKSAVVDMLCLQLDDLTLSELMRKLPTGRRGANLSPQVMEQISFGQGLIKAPDFVILDRALASHDDAARAQAFAALRELLPEATVLQLETEPPRGAFHDRELRLQKGKIVALGEDGEEMEEPSAETTDLQTKLQALRKAPLFRELTRQQLRLLAFSARWVTFTAGSYVFRKHDLPDGAFLIFEGEVALIERTEDGGEAFALHPPVGTLVGELGLIRNDPRRLDMRCETDVTLLRIEAGDFLSILETDARTSFKLIQSLIGYLDRPK